MGASEIFRTSAASALKRFNSSNCNIWVQTPQTSEHLPFRTDYISQTLSLLTVPRVNVITTQTSRSSLDNSKLNKCQRTTSQWQQTRRWVGRTAATEGWFCLRVRATTTRNLMRLRLGGITKKLSRLAKSQVSSRTSWVAMEALLLLLRCRILSWHHLEITTTRCLLLATPRMEVLCRLNALIKISATVLREAPMVPTTKRYNWYKLINIKSGKNKLRREVTNFNLNIYFRE
jgi:hypothetical protein